MRVTFLTIMPSPYMRDLFEAIAADGRIELTVLYMEMSAPATHWGAVSLRPYARVLPGGWRTIGGGRVHWNPGATRAVRESAPDAVVVAGYASLTAQVVMRWLHWRGIPWIFWGERSGMRQLDGWKRRLRALARYPATAWPDAIAAMGTVAAHEYERIAAGGCPVVNIPYYTDLQPFLDHPRRPGNGEVRLLYCGQLIERKGVNHLLDAFVPLADEFPHWTLTLVGDGPLRATLSARIPAQVRSQVRFAGFQPIARLPHYFANADLFVLPSRHDGWGVVVNQALGAGLPIVCTDAVGAAQDLVTNDQNGVIVPADDPRAMQRAIRTIATDPAKLREYGRVSRERAWDWTPDHGADRWANLAASVLERRPVLSRF